jgi:YD repeat-containing protein
LNYSTAYTYDALNNLQTVNQSGQTRTFTYDSLSRLYQAQNPESSVGGTQCTTTYNYDANGNVISKVAPLENQNTSCSNTVTTTYTPDVLNRVTDKTYNDGVTPPAHFAYDETTVSLGSCSNSSMSYPVGRLTHTTTGSSGAYLTATVQDYDPMGRVSSY